MKKLHLKTDSGSYDILIGAGLLPAAGQYLRDGGFGDRAVVITDTTVNNHYGDMLRQSLAASGIKSVILTVSPGEQQKSLAVAGELYLKLSEAGAERGTPVIALGGGVIGDLAGFVAATFKRGVPFIQIPTTLLAQIDSSVGGKVAVDHGRLKNEIGAFYQPGLVITDIATLRTLPPREISNGLAEIIKHAVIADSDLFAYLENNIARITRLVETIMEEVIYRSVSIKAGVVAQDEKDTGVRNILNFGHTAGHAVESASGFSLKHGEAVALGMLVAGAISRRMELWHENEAERLKNIIIEAGLPVKFPAFDVEKILELITHDKKVRGGRVRFVLPKSIGAVFITDQVEMTMVREVLDEFHSST